MIFFSYGTLYQDGYQLCRGWIVGYRNQICLISENRPTQCGHNTYFLKDIDGDRTYVAFKHQLEKAIHLDIVTLDDIDDVVMTEPMVGPQEPTGLRSIDKWGCHHTHH